MTAPWHDGHVHATVASMVSPCVWHCVVISVAPIHRSFPVKYASRSRSRARPLALALTLAAAFASSYALPRAQTVKKKALTVEDYSKWRSLSGQEISGDGQWVTYGLSFSNTVPAESKPVLHLVRLET